MVSAGVNSRLKGIVVARMGGRCLASNSLQVQEASNRPRGCPPKDLSQLLNRRAYQVRYAERSSQGSALGKMNHAVCSRVHSKLTIIKAGMDGLALEAAEPEESRGWALGNTDCPSSWLGGTAKKVCWPRWVLVMT